jgi:hypothetical protein
MSTQFLHSIRESETVTCRRCNTRQYPRNGACVRCQASLPLEYLTIQLDTLINSYSAERRNQLAHGLGLALRHLRKRRRMSQSQLASLAAKMNRSYLSRAECGHVLLPLGALLPLARALGLTAVILRFEANSSLTVHQSNNRP